jgi:hypothetical protein
MENILKGITDHGWHFGLSFDGKSYTMWVSRPKWEASDLAQSIPLPSWKSESLYNVCINAYNYCASKEY